MKKMLKILNQLDSAEFILSTLLDLHLQVSIEPLTEDSFYVTLNGESDEDYGCCLISIVVHAEDENDLTYHIVGRHTSNKYDYDKLAQALAGSIGIYEKYQRKE